MLLVKTVNYEDEVEFWLGKSEEMLEECQRDGDGDSDSDDDNYNVLVHWFYGTVKGGVRSETNDLNARFHPWFKKAEGTSRVKNAKVLERTARTGVVMIGVELTANGDIKVQSKKAIGFLGIGYQYERTEKKLVYARALVEA